MSQFTQACLRNATFDLLCSHMREGVKQCYDQSVSFNLAKRNSTIAWTCPIHPCTYLPIPFSIGHSPILLCNSAHIRQKWSITVPCSVLYGTSQANIDKLQRVQNILARIVVGAPWTSSSLNISSRFTLVTCWSSYYLQTVSHHLENTSYFSASLPVWTHFSLSSTQILAFFQYKSRYQTSRYY